MPTFDKRILTEHAKQLGFLTAPFEKMSRLIEVLQFLNEREDLREKLALKGGTSINLTVFDLPRLSVDIDLDFTKNLTREKTRIERNKINSILERYMAAAGYIKTDKSKRTHILDSYVFSYINVAGNRDNIKVEINYSLRSHVLPYSETETLTTGIFPQLSIRTLNPIEIFASKIVALSSRAAARDLYDINNMVQFKVFNESEKLMLRKCAAFYVAVAGEVSEATIDFSRMEDITAYKVKTDLIPMLRKTERFDVHVARNQVFDFLREDMALSDNECIFLKQFRVGSFKPQLLFEDDEIIKRIENHPVAIWRLRNIHDKQEQ